MDELPTVGLIVHVYSSTKTPEAAIVTGVTEEGYAELYVFGHGRPPFTTVAPFLSTVLSTKPNEGPWCAPLPEVPAKEAV